MAEIDWTASMQQTFEFYIVDPATWGNKRKLENITGCTISKKSDDETLGGATFVSTEVLDECYVRVYLICIQNRVRFEFPLGTFMVQTPKEMYNGRVKNITIDAYTPLIELKDNTPPYGFTAMAGEYILSTVSNLVLENVRAPVSRAESDDTFITDFVSDFDSDTWLSYLTDALGTIDYKFGLDDMGRILFEKKQDLTALTPIWTFDDGNSSILYPEVTVSRDLYGVPNVVEVLYSQDNGFKFARVENNDENSPVSIPSRGRRVVHRVTNPDDLADDVTSPSQDQINDYAKNLLRDLSSLEYTVSYTHGYCPVRVGDAVWLNYEKAGIKNIRAVVTSQDITCRPGCPVTEEAVFTKNLWG